MNDESIRWPTWDELANDKGEVRVRLLEPKSQLKSRPYLAPLEKIVRSGMNAAATILEFRKQKPNVLEITVPEPNHMHVMMLHIDTDLMREMEREAPAGLRITFSTLDDLIAKGEKLMRHFRGD